MKAEKLELTETYWIPFGGSDKWTHLEWEPISACQVAAEMTMKSHMASDGWEIPSQAPAPQMVVWLFLLCIQTTDTRKNLIELITHGWHCFKFIASHISIWRQWRSLFYIRVIQIACWILTTNTTYQVGHFDESILHLMYLFLKLAFSADKFYFLFFTKINFISFIYLSPFFITLQI